jgi:hypothetical protein
VSGEGLRFKVEGWKLRVGGLRVTSFFKVLCFRHFAKQNNLPPYFFIKRLPDFSAKKEKINLGCGMKINIHQLFGLFAAIFCSFLTKGFPLLSRSSSSVNLFSAFIKAEIVHYFD